MTIKPPWLPIDTAPLHEEVFLFDRCEGVFTGKVRQGSWGLCADLKWRRELAACDLICWMPIPETPDVSNLDVVMESFKMEGSIPMNHEDYLSEIDGELVIIKQDGRIIYVS